MSSNKEEVKHIDKELDLSNAGRGVWLVKVPKYLANKWEKLGGADVGKLRITKQTGQKTQVSLVLDDCVNDVDSEEPISKHHQLDVTIVKQQMLGVFSHTTQSKGDSSPDSEKLFMEGRIVQKLECRPNADTAYMALKKKSIQKAAEPERKVQSLDRIVQNFKPVSDHRHNIEYRERKKAEGKKARDDKHHVQEMLFKAFEQHQYYNIKDLVKITKQPIAYLKEVLKEFCDYNMKNPHKNMWELKKEYRHYKTEEKKTEAAEPMSDSD